MEKKFENMYLAVNHNQEVMPNHILMLNAYGQNGWEVSGVVDHLDTPDKKDALVFFLKREIQQSEALSEVP